MYNESYGDNPVTKDWFLSWNYNNPFGDHLNIGVKSDEKLIGHFSAVPVRFNGNQKNIKYGYLTYGIAVSPEYQDKSVAYYLGKELLKIIKKNSCDFVYGFPNKKALEIIKLLGYDHYSNFNIYRITGLLPARKDISVKKTTVEQFLESFQNFSSVSDNSFGIEHSDMFLRWRFKDTRYNYKTYVFKKKSNPIGIVIGKEYQGDFDVLFIQKLENEFLCFDNFEIDILSILKENYKYNKLLVWAGEKSVLWDAIKNNCEIHNDNNFYFCGFFTSGEKLEAPNLLPCDCDYF